MENSEDFGKLARGSDFSERVKFAELLSQRQNENRQILKLKILKISTIPQLIF